jgi:hypothetical protein
VVGGAGALLIPVRWTVTALDGFKTISRIEQQRNLATADRVCHHIYESVQTCGDNRLQPETVQIFHICYGAQDWR